MKQTIIHISDLHFHKYPKKIIEWKSKRFLGIANLFFRRARQFPLHRSKKLVEQISRMKWDHLVISGDITQLSLESEFDLARKTLDPLLEDKSRVSIIPGNHDRYVLQNYSKDFFKKYFGEFFGSSEIHFRKLKFGWVLVGWDSVHPNGWLTAAGTVKRSTIKATEDIIKSFPQNTRFIIVNHYPLTFPEGWKFDQFHELYNLLPVKKWVLSHPQIRIYLHGHIHKNWVHNIPREADLELLLVNSASSNSIPYKGQESSFHKIELEGDNVKVFPINLN